MTNLTRTLMSAFSNGPSKFGGDASYKRGLPAAVGRGEVAKLRWVELGEVISGVVLAAHWRVQNSSLERAEQRGELFSIRISGLRWYPGEFLAVDQQTAAVVSEALDGLSPETKLAFWKRSHGALGGKNVLELLHTQARESALVKVIELAMRWVEESADR